MVFNTIKISKYYFRKQLLQKKLCAKTLNPNHPEPVEGQINNKQINNKPQTTFVILSPRRTTPLTLNL
jgi:hypothetical protein